MPSSTVENYLKQIFMLQPHSAHQLVSMGKLAEAVGVAPGTATAMVKALAESNLVKYERRGRVKLSPSGKQLALHVLRRHRLIELFLVNVLGLDWSQVHEEAEELEHAISDRVLEKIDQVLGHPTVDPHGDPIPNAKGDLRRPKLSSLADCRTGQSVQVQRISDQDPTFLRFADQHGLTPGVSLSVLDANDASDAVTVQSEGRPSVTMGKSAASQVFVQATP